jgi:hypothetical protein
MASKYAFPIDAGEYAFVSWSDMGCLSYSSSSLEANSDVANRRARARSFGLKPADFFAE